MKKSYWVALAASLSTSLIAQTVSPPAPITPLSNSPASSSMATPASAAATNGSPARTANRRNATGQGSATRTRGPRPAATNTAPAAVSAPKLAVLVPGPAVITGSNVNVRGQASLVGEIICRLNPGDPITVLESIAVEKPKKDEPVQWARIAFPTNAHVWVFSSYIDATNRIVKVAKLNLRGGPGENYSVVGTLKRGDTVKEITSREQWTQIEPPTNAFAFVAAEFVKQEGIFIPGPVPVPPSVGAAGPPPVAPPGNPVPAIALQTNEVVAVPPVAATLEPTNAAVIPQSTLTNEASIMPTVPSVIATTEPMPPLTVPNEIPPTITPPPLELEPLPIRIVQREGIVRSTWSIQAPSAVELANPDTGATMDYLYSPSPQVNLKRYRGLRVLVTGEEGLDKRWKNTPVLVIQKIQVVE